jgi:hypothetical protein
LLGALERLRQPENHTKLLLPVINYADLSFRENQFTKLIDDKNILGVTPAFSQGLGGDNIVRFWVPYLQGTALDSGAKEIFWSMPVTALAMLQAAGKQNWRRPGTSFYTIRRTA